MNVKFFKTQTNFRKWLEKNHDKAQELWVGYYKKATGKQTITYHESLDEALCFGWIDGVRKKVDEESYAQRFSPRKPKSSWSKVNLARFGKLKEAGLVAPPGFKCFEDRDQKKSGYSIQERPENLDARYEKRFKANKKAWEFFQSQAPGYRRNAVFWVTSAKQEETRERRFAQLIEVCDKGIKFGVLSPGSKQK
ncbi:MAG TPA: YdeI/OmpD-associated family protein [Acidobacteriota bacterium]|nr:YdeI/OmpD-associated family protein [Acidobacteriota bacterium]